MNNQPITIQSAMFLQCSVFLIFRCQQESANHSTQIFHFLYSPIIGLVFLVFFPSFFFPSFHLLICVFVNFFDDVIRKKTKNVPGVFQIFRCRACFRHEDWHNCWSSMVMAIFGRLRPHMTICSKITRESRYL